MRRLIIIAVLVAGCAEQDVACVYDLDEQARPSVIRALGTAGAEWPEWVRANVGEVHYYPGVHGSPCKAGSLACTGGTIGGCPITSIVAEMAATEEAWALVHEAAHRDCGHDEECCFQSSERWFRDYLRAWSARWGKPDPCKGRPRCDIFDPSLYEGVEE